MDADLNEMSREQLVAEVVKLRNAIRQHRDSTGHQLCWHHPAMWALLPESSAAPPVVPDWPDFLRGCIQYRQSLDEQLPHAPRSSETYHADQSRLILDFRFWILDWKNSGWRTSDHRPHLAVTRAAQPRR
jgi:hypothetical protein